MLNTLFNHEWIMIGRGNILKIGFTVYSLLAVYAVYKGNSLLQTQRSIIHTIDTAQANRYQTLLKSYEKVDTLTKAGKNSFRLASNSMRVDMELKSMVNMQAHPYSALSIGQIDNQTFYNQVSLWSNVYNTGADEISNPQKLMVGNLDLAYLLIFLLPLLVIGWNYNVLSDEMESGTLLLLKASAQKMSLISGGKLLFRFGVLFVLVTILDLVFFTGLANPFQHAVEIGWWLLFTFAYLLFWFALVFLIASFNGSGRFNAIILACTWVIVLYVVPAALNRYMEYGSNDLEKTSLAEARDNDAKVWKMPASILIDSLRKGNFHTDFKQFPVTDSPSFKYAAFIEFGHRFNDRIGKANDEVKLFNEKKTFSFNLFNPVFSTLSSLNELTRSDQSAYIHYTNAVRHYQQQRRSYIYQFMLGKKPFWIKEYEHFPKFNYQTKPINTALVFSNFCLVLFASVIFITTGAWVGSRRLG